MAIPHCSGETTSTHQDEVGPEDMMEQELSQKVVLLHLGEWKELQENV